VQPARLLLLFALITLIAIFFLLDLGQYLDLEYLKDRQAGLNAYKADHPFIVAGVFFLVYIIVTGLSLPGAAIMTIAAGAIFGLLWGTVIASFASSIGATIAFLAARFLFRDVVQRHFSARLAAINKGVEEDGPLYLFMLRLVPVFPFFVINLAMALTSMPAFSFYVVSQIGMLAGTIVFVNAGTQLARINAPADILSLQVVASFALLGIFPLLAKKLVSYIRKRRNMSDTPFKAQEINE